MTRIARLDRLDFLLLKDATFAFRENGRINPQNFCLFFKYAYFGIQIILWALSKSLELWPSFSHMRMEQNTQSKRAFNKLSYFHHIR